MNYRNNSRVYEKPRRVTGWSLGENAGLNGTFLFSPRLGLSVDLQYIDSDIKTIRVFYHDETIKVKYPENKPLRLTRLNISAGLRHCF
jgi:hypothetical protein